MKNILLFFWEEMKPYKWWYLFVIQTIFLAPFSSVMVNYALKELVDTITNLEKFEASKFYFATFLYIFAEIYVNIVWRLSNYGCMMCIPQTLNSILLKSYNYVSHHSYRFFTENMQGAIISKINGVVTGFNFLRSDIHFNFGRAFVSVIIYFSVILYTSPFIGIFIALWCIPFTFIIHKLALKLAEANEIDAKEGHKVKGMIADRIANIFNLFSFASRRREYDFLKQHIEKNVLPKQKNSWKWEIIFQATGALFYVILFAFTIWYVIYLKYFGSLTVGDTVFLLGMSFKLSEELWNVSIHFGDMSSHWGELKSSFEIIKKPQEILDKKTAIELQI